MWEKRKSLTEDAILIKHLAHKNSIQTNISITKKNYCLAWRLNSEDLELSHRCARFNGKIVILVRKTEIFEIYFLL